MGQTGNLFSTGQLLEPEACEAIIELARSCPLEESKLGGGKTNKKTRDSAHRWLRRSDPRFADLFGRVDSAVADANGQCHGVDYDPQGCDSLQFTEYSEAQHYAPHIDSYFRGGKLERKLSTSILLSDPATVEGGGFVINGIDLEPKRGEMIVFPSCAPHGVKPVTSVFAYPLSLGIMDHHGDEPMKPFAVPSKRRAQPRVAAAGTYPATLVQIVEISLGQFERGGGSARRTRPTPRGRSASSRSRNSWTPPSWATP